MNLSSQNVQTRASHGRELKSYTCTHQLKLICVHSGKCFAAADCLQLDKDRYCKGVELLRENFQCSTFFPRKAHGYCNFAHGEPSFTASSAFPHLVSNESAPPLIEDFGFGKGTKMDKKRTWHHALRSVQQSSTSPVFIDFRMLRFCFDSHLRFDQNACKSYHLRTKHLLSCARVSQARGICDCTCTPNMHHFTVRVFT